MATSNISIGTTTTILSHAETNEKRVIFGMFFCNTGTVEAKITLYLYPSGGSPSDSTMILKQWPIYVGGTLQFEATDKLFLDAGDTLSAISDTADIIKTTISYYVM